MRSKLLLVLLIASFPALAEHRCTIYDFACIAPNYPILKDDGECKCSPAHESPSPINVLCTRTENDHFCEAWPQGDDISYDWHHTSGLVAGFSSPTYQPLQVFSCTDHELLQSVTVSVSSPYGVTGNKTSILSCSLGTPMQ